MEKKDMALLIEAEDTLADMDAVLEQFTGYGHANGEFVKVDREMASYLLDKAAHETGMDKALRASFPEDWDRILTCAYYLASEGDSLCHVEQWSVRNRHSFHSKLADQRVSGLVRRITPSAQQKFFEGWNSTGNCGRIGERMKGISLFSLWLGKSEERKRREN